MFHDNNRQRSVASLSPEIGIHATKSHLIQQYTSIKHPKEISGRASRTRHHLGIKQNIVLVVISLISERLCGKKPPHIHATPTTDMWRQVQFGRLCYLQTQIQAGSLFHMACLENPAAPMHIKSPLARVCPALIPA
jgi:hypothetical protein